jgi:hypothetical protein
LEFLVKLYSLRTGHLQERPSWKLQLVLKIIVRTYAVSVELSLFDGSGFNSSEDNKQLTLM